MDALAKLVALKPGLKTTEFWSHAIVSFVGLLVGLHIIHTGTSGGAQWVIQLAAFLSAGINTGLYATSRGRAKSGTAGITTILTEALHNLMNSEDQEKAAAGLKTLMEISGADAGAISQSGRLAKIEQFVKAHDTEFETIWDRLEEIFAHDVPTVVNNTFAEPQPTDDSGALIPTPDQASAVVLPSVADGGGTVDPGPAGFPADATAIA